MTINMTTNKFKLPKVSTLALAIAISGTLALGACGKKDKPKSAANIEKVEARKVSDAEAMQALAAFSLDTSGSGKLQWDKRDGSGGNYTFTDVKINNEKETSTIGQVEIWGAHMADEQANFDKIEFRDMAFISDDGDDTTMKIASIALVKPSPALAVGLAKSFGGDEDAFENMDGDIGFQAISFTGFNLTDDDVNMSIKSMSMGEAKDKTGVFSLSGLTLDGKGDGGKNIKMSLGSIDVTGANLEKYKGLIKAISNSDENGNLNEAAMADMMKTMNIYDPDFKTASIQDFDMNVGGLLVTMKSLTASADKKGGKTTIASEMSPLVINPPKDNKNADLQQMTETLAALGYESLEFTMAGTTVMDEKDDTMIGYDTYIEMKDGFRLSYDYDMSGYKAFMEKMTAMSAQGDAADPMAAMAMMNDLQINKFSISLRDDSIVDRGFKFAAAQQGGTADALKSQAKAMLGFATMAAQDEAQQKLATEMVAALTTLIDNGGTLTIDMNPGSPVNIGEIVMGGMSGQFDVEALGLSIRTD
ncbi:MAG: hypothetical protein COA91_03550 [Robiginitomaculum sp.]|nr:MAG: hypothetical protein COA91_03550 [Robiginitomaculum sp.]